MRLILDVQRSGSNLVFDVQVAAAVFAWAPAGSGFMRATERQTRPASISQARPAAIQRNSR